MASSSADWVLGPVRLISSTSSTSANSGPRRNTNSFFDDIEHVRADDVAGHEIRGALHALELAAEHARQRLRQQRLAEARRALHQHVAARDQRDAQRADHVLGADDDARQLALHGLFEGCDRGIHVFSRRSRWSRRFCSGTSGSLRCACASAYQAFELVELLRQDGRVTLEPVPQFAALGARVARAPRAARATPAKK